MQQILFKHLLYANGVDAVVKKDRYSPCRLEVDSLARETNREVCVVKVQGVREHMACTTNRTGILKEGTRIGFQRKRHLSWGLRSALGLGRWRNLCFRKWGDEAKPGPIKEMEDVQVPETVGFRSGLARDKTENWSNVRHWESLTVVVFGAVSGRHSRNLGQIEMEWFQMTLNTFLCLSFSPSLSDMHKHTQSRSRTGKIGGGVICNKSDDRWGQLGLIWWGMEKSGYPKRYVGTDWVIHGNPGGDGVKNAF